MNPRFRSYTHPIFTVLRFLPGAAARSSAVFTGFATNAIGIRFFLSLAIMSVMWASSARSQTLETRPPQSETAAPRAFANNNSVYTQLRDIKIGSEKITVKDFVLKRESAAFTFKSGTFYLLAPVNDKITGAVFVGEASFTIQPPIDVERRNLAILTQGQPFEEQFSSAVFRFTDGAEVEIRKAQAPDAAASGSEPSGLLSDVQQQLKKKYKENLSARLLQDVMSSQPGGKFVAFIKGKKYGDKEVYDVDPHGAVVYFPSLPGRIRERLTLEPEEVAFSTLDENHFGVWAAFHYSREYAAGTANSDEQNGSFSIELQKLKTSFDRHGALTGQAITTLTARQNGVRVLAFDLYPTLRVESVTGEDGKQLPFVQEEKDEDGDFSIILPRELKQGETYTVTSKYAGKDVVSDEGGGNYYPIARDNWYPSLGFGHYARYEMSFGVPKGMRMVATGKLLRSVDEGNESITDWTSEIPFTVAGFNFGKFKREEGKPAKQPYLLETFANPEPPDMIRTLQRSNDEFNGPTDTHLGNEASLLGQISTVGLMKKAMSEAQIAVDLYTNFFGEAPYKRLALTQQTAPTFGQSFPGLVYLPITYFFDSTIRHTIGFDDAHGYFKVVGPHEIAHQWWGHMVGFNSYRDQWISEGFAEMSASIFMQVVYSQHGLDDFHKFWADERTLLTQKNREGRRAIDVGPVTLGYRLATARSGFSIPRSLIYPKGGYILHMVRMMLRDDSSPDQDGIFKATMHEFTSTYTNRPASTEDFKAILEKHMTPQMDLEGNHKMDWFFREYVYGTQYPSYRSEHSFSTDAQGDVVLKLKITQSDVSEDFAMLVPIYLELSDGRVAHLGAARLIGSKPFEQEIPLKGLKVKPKRAMICYFDDVLGNIENK